MTTAENVGMIGVGLMGHGIAKNILKKGHPLTIMGHRNRKPVEDLVTKGAREVKTPAELAKTCDLIVICVTGSPQVEEIILGENGILESGREGLIIVDCSTCKPNSTLMLSQRLGEKGAVLVDAPLARTPKEAEEGRLNVMVGADDAIFAKIRPVIETFAENIYHIGPVGTGHTIKLINNFLGIGAAALTSEAAVLAAAYGVDLRRLFELVSAGGANSAMFQMVMPWILEGDDSRAQFSINNAHKDISYLAEMSASQKQRFKLVDAVRRNLEVAREQGLGDEFLPHLIDALARIHNIKLSKE